MVLYREIVHRLGWPNLVEIQNTKKVNKTEYDRMILLWIPFIIIIKSVKTTKVF